MKEQILIDALKKIEEYSRGKKWAHPGFEFIDQIATEALAAASQSTDKEEDKKIYHYTFRQRDARNWLLDQSESDIENIDKLLHRYYQYTFDYYKTYLPDQSTDKVSAEWVDILKELNRKEIYFRIENDDNSFYFLSIIDRKIYPRVWADTFNDGAKVIIESEESLLQRTISGGKDWIDRFGFETPNELFKKLSEYAGINLETVDKGDMQLVKWLDNEIKKADGNLGAFVSINHQRTWIAALTHVKVNAPLDNKDAEGEKEQLRKDLANAELEIQRLTYLIHEK